MHKQTGKLLEPMAQAARKFKGGLDGILALWTQGVMTAYMQVLNSLY